MTPAAGSRTSSGLAAPAAADAATLLGAEWTAVAAAVDAFDHHTTAFRQLAEEWLEENHVRGPPRLEEARRAVQAVLE